ncbi:response regulator transcription factor [Ornithinimicrobium humiphilum]|uniref:LuxR family two component transcriptional regulator n=1 Tax=Ornithinimicrobium humiphilum TaxID=125288 RepID=A0A543KL40_9MICO|nr:response regulator transcription factor [Ornithinimicrobium humiphilum]TQM95797.1 LuxR family two component transcriptional regulator [Ornithinimicrobium humiphilum]
MTDKPISVLVADDNAIVRMGIRALLDQFDGIHVVGEAWDGDHAVEMVRRLQPTVTLLDVRMPRRDGVAAAEVISASTKVVMLTYSDSPDVVRSAIRAGACGYLVHGAFEPADVEAAVRGAARGVGTLSPAAVVALAQEEQRSQVRTDHDLSAREVEVMTLIAQGRSNRQIATELFLSEKTVKNHINRIFAKLGVTGRAQAVSWWLGATEDA